MIPLRVLEVSVRSCVVSVTVSHCKQKLTIAFLDSILHLESGFL